MRVRVLVGALSAALAVVGVVVALQFASQDPRESMRVCLTNSADRQACVERTLTSASSEEQIFGILNTIEQYAQGNVDFTVNECHEAVHATAVRAIEVLGQSAFAYPEITCQGGYIHGLFLSVHDRSLDELRRMHQTCLTAGGPEPSLKRETNCDHGFGHGVTLVLPDGPLSTSIETCATLGDSESRSMCVDGAMMSFQDALRALFLARNTNEEPVGELTNMPTVLQQLQDERFVKDACLPFSEKELAWNCWGYASRILAMISTDAEGHLTWCAQSPVVSCGYGMGMERYGNYQDQNDPALGSALGVCDRLGNLAGERGKNADEYRQACQFGLVYPLNEPTRVAGAQDYAGCAVLPGRDQKACRTGVEKLFFTA
jgi:hypothetical protein